MSWYAKVNWSEGLFLRPHHLQQADRHFENLLESRTRHVSPYPWGFALIEIDGDLVMTANGFAVFRSDKSGAVSAANFIALSKSSSVPKNFRPELTAMERAGIWDRQSGPYSDSSADAVASSAAVVTAVTTTVAPRLRKGVVTVDDGDPTR